MFYHGLIMHPQHRATQACCLLALSAGLMAQQATAQEAPACNDQFQPAPDGFVFINNLQQKQEYSVPPGSRIGTIHISRLPIFDLDNPKENNWLYRLGNRLHIMTRDQTVRQVLLFEEGESYDQRIMEESERILRDQGYLYNSAIRPVSQCNDVVDVEVITKDTWTLALGASWDRSGGEDTYNFSISESNLFGFGKQIRLAQEHDIDRDVTELLYNDDNLLGSRHVLSLGVADSDDGFSQYMDIGLPFYALDSRRSWELRMTNELRDDNLYFRGDEQFEVSHRIKDLLLQYGISNGLNRGYTHRFYLGYQYRSDVFGPGDEFPPPPQMPADRELSYPFIAYEVVEDHFDTTFNLNQLYRTEDLHLGRQFYQRIGYSATGLGADLNRIVFDGRYSNTLFYGDGFMWNHDLIWSGRWNLDTEDSEDLVVSYGSRFFKRWSTRHAFYAKLEATWTHNLSENEQVVLGGQTGARAFDNRFQTGDRSVILSLEERLYTDIHLFNLVRVGAAVFVDVGSAWTPGGDNGTEQRTLADAGIGLRFASSKAASNRMAHLDLAFPLTNQDDEAVDDYQIAFNIKADF